MAPVAGHEFPQEALRRGADVVVVQTEAGEPAGHATAAHVALQPSSVARLVAGVRELAVGPLRRRGDHLGDDGRDPVLGRQVQLSVVGRPVVAPWRHLHRRPKEPVAKDSHPVFGGGAIVALPILPGRVRVPEVNGTVGERGKH